MTSYRETFDRHRRLLCAPVVLAAVLALWFTLGTPKTYESTAALWVDNPAPEPSSLTETNPELRTPAEQQQLLVGELLQTRSFRVAVADRSPLRAYLAAGAPTGWAPTAMLHALAGRRSLDAQILSALGPKHLIAAVQGPQLLTLKYRGPTPTVVAGTLAALIKELTARRVAVDVERGVRTRAFYQEQVDAAQKGVAEADAAVADYQRANPTAGPGDPNLKAALRAQRVAGQDLAQSTTKLNQARSETQGPDASDTGVDVMDAPRAPTGPVSGKAKVLEALIGGLFAGGLIALLGLVALTPSRSGPTDPLAALGQSRVTLSPVNGAGSREAVARNGHAPTRATRRPKKRGGRA